DYGTAGKIAKLNIERASGQALIVMGHLRRASVGGFAAQQFSHPFVEGRDGVTWAFQHNGSLVNDVGDSSKIDSQLLFELFLELLDGRDPEPVAKATTAVRHVAIQKHRACPALNLLLADGTAP